MEYTAIIEKTESGMYVAQCQEMPAAITQGKTIEEVKENLIDAINLLLLDEIEDAKLRNKGIKTLKRKIKI